MIDLFYQGGILFMGIISLIFMGALAMAVRTGLLIYAEKSPDVIFRGAGYVKSIGLLALVVGVLGQMIGLYSAYESIEQVSGGISPALLAGGLKVSSITTIYGMICYVLSILMYFGLCAAMKKSAT